MKSGARYEVHMGAVNQLYWLVGERWLEGLQKYNMAEFTKFVSVVMFFGGLMQVLHCNVFDL